MKKEVHPGIIVAVIVCVVAAAGMLLWKANTDKPSYPGTMAGHPGQGPMTGPPQGRMTPQDAAQKYHISGANPNAGK